MRILIVHSTYRSGAASGENQVVNDEARLLHDAGHEVVVFDPTPQVEGTVALLRAARDVIWSREAARVVRSLIRENHVDIVHCHNILTGLSPSVVWAAKSQDVATVMTLHNYRMMCLPGTFLRDGKVCELCLGRIPWRGARFSCYQGSAAASAVLGSSVSVHRGISTFDRIDRFLAVSRFLREKHIEAGLAEDRIEVKPNFAWPLTRSIGGGDYFLYMGRLAPEKGVATLLECWRDVRDVRLLVVGDGPAGNDLRRSAPASVQFLGTMPHSRVGELLRGARGLMVPSLWYEGAPRSILEAFAAGVPVLASRIGALPEVVTEGISGLLVEPGDPRAWVEAVQRMADDAFALRLGQGAFDTYERLYTPETALKQLEDVYEQVLGSHRS
jgi:glycosyltransferase involved in cell wall biosynthesis